MMPYVKKCKSCKKYFDTTNKKQVYCDMCRNSNTCTRHGRVSSWDRVMLG